MLQYAKMCLLIFVVSLTRVRTYILLSLYFGACFIDLCESCPLLVSNDFFSSSFCSLCLVVDINTLARECIRSLVDTHPPHLSTDQTKSRETREEQVG